MNDLLTGRSPSRVKLSSQIKLTAACKRLSKEWFPANPQHLRMIQRKIAQGIYQGDVSALLGDLKADLSLFTFCLRELLLLLQSGQLTAADEGSNPFDLFRAAGVEAIGALLSLRGESVSSHSFDAGTRLQALRFQQVLVSASTAETLSRKTQLAAGEVFTSAVLRQLGLTLISWNYPQLYRRALEASAQGAALDAALSKELGYSPKLLAIALVREWGAPATLLASMGDVILDEHGQQDQEVLRIGASIAKLCEVGEALARASDPEHYPSARSDWQTASHCIETLLGPSGVHEIMQRVHESVRSYRALDPQLFEMSDKFSFNSSLHAETQQPELSNRWIPSCPSQAQKLFHQLYARLQPGKLHKGDVLFLLREVIPQVGFTSGCIYIFDFDALTLVPRFQIGQDTEVSYERIDCSPLAKNPSPEAQAFRSGEIVMRHDPWGGRNKSFIVGPLGAIQKAGVVFFELPPGYSAHAGSTLTNCFRAVVQALQDCLHLQ